MKHVLSFLLLTLSACTLDIEVHEAATNPTEIVTGEPSADDVEALYTECSAGCPTGRCYNLFTLNPSAQYDACTVGCTVGVDYTCPQTVAYPATCRKYGVKDGAHNGACVLSCESNECPDGMACAPTAEGSVCVWKA